MILVLDGMLAITTVIHFIRAIPARKVLAAVHIFPDPVPVRRAIRARAVRGEVRRGGAGRCAGGAERGAHLFELVHNHIKVIEQCPALHIPQGQLEALRTSIIEA